MRADANIADGDTPLAALMHETAAATVVAPEQYQCRTVCPQAGHRDLLATCIEDGCFRSLVTNLYGDLVPPDVLRTIPPTLDPFGLGSDLTFFKPHLT